MNNNSYLLLPVVVVIIIIIVVVAFVANKYVDLLWKWNYFLNGSLVFFFFFFVAFCTVLLYYGECFEFFLSAGVFYSCSCCYCLGYG